ncbi:aminoglycoside phosphotransferase family protein [Paenibacillus sp. D2_2]|uniref:phosphotransferase family protein n=1 Tax=Paenibacillus sp. D2_2 TaxID=3073092 RepID=UPI0028153CFF|nr:aminoglycoside phosphotransferase family protein [Paenibacillus sp. D2_2]WMT39088.1 aminoglycoside phosphotransferase family protein [Paenibacillus sp. D2_2]
MSSLENNARQLLSEATLQWLQQQAGPGSAIEQVNALKGGVSSAVFRIKGSKHGETHEYVLRQFTDHEWLESEPDLAEHESVALNRAYEAGVPSPQWIAGDFTGEFCGIPSVLMTRLDGEVILRPLEMQGWLDGLAGALAGLHGADTTPMKWKYFSYNNISALQIPDWTNSPEAWGKIIKRVQGDVPAYMPRLIHRDYHPTNVLWENGKVSGIVDWVNCCYGPAGIDTGHCRVNLVQLYGVKTADAFLEAYLHSPGSTEEVTDCYWDMLSLTDFLWGPPEVYQGWIDLGFTGLNPQIISARIDEYAESLSARL